MKNGSVKIAVFAIFVLNIPFSIRADSLRLGIAAESILGVSHSPRATLLQAGMGLEGSLEFTATNRFFIAYTAGFEHWEPSLPAASGVYFRGMDAVRTGMAFGPVLSLRDDTDFIPCVSGSIAVANFLGTPLVFAYPQAEIYPRFEFHASGLADISLAFPLIARFKHDSTLFSAGIDAVISIPRTRRRE